jgi:hypothetical protein
MPAKLTEITGIVVPARWDESGNVTGTAIHSFDENEYIIEYDRSGELLSKLIHKSVVVTGRVRERLDGKKLIRVMSVKSVSNENLNYVAGREVDERAV